MKMKTVKNIARCRRGAANAFCRAAKADAEANPESWGRNDFRRDARQERKIARLWIAKAEALEAEAKEPAAAVDAIAEEEVDSEADAPIGVTAAGLARMFERGGE